MVPRKARHGKVTMYQGFYELTSGMLTQRRNLNVIANNMSNVETPGYKSDTQVNSTFAEEMLIRTGRTDKTGRKDLATTTPIVTAKETVTDYSQGTLEETDNPLDIAISGNGFFRIGLSDGSEQYTRNGQFSLKDDGTLVLSDIGNVLDENGNPITLKDENFTVRSDGTILDKDGQEVARIGLTDFEDYTSLHKEDNGMLSAADDAAKKDVSADTTLLQNEVERSNVNLIDEMTSMMSSQRALQSAAQVLKMYDGILDKAANDVGRV